MKRYLSILLVLGMFLMTLGGIWTIAYADNDDTINFEYTVYSTDSIELTGSSSINGNTAMNTGNLNITGSSKINGGLYLPQGNSVGYGSQEITGGIHYTDAAKTFAMPGFSEAPDNLIKLEDLTIGNWPIQSYTIEQDAWYDSLSLVGNSELTINVGDGQRVLRIGTFDLSQGHIKLVGSGKLFIFADQVFSVNGSSTLNSGGSSDKVHIFVSGSGTVNMSGSTKINGNIYAPYADLNIAGSAQLIGNAVIGGTEVDLSGNTPFIGAMYSPNAVVELNGSSEISGAVICKKMELVGNSHVNNKPINCIIPGYLTEAREIATVPTVTLSKDVQVSGNNPYNILLKYTSDIVVENSIYSLYRKTGKTGIWELLGTSTNANGAFEDVVSNYGTYSYKIGVVIPDGSQSESNQISVNLGGTANEDGVIDFEYTVYATDRIEMTGSSSINGNTAMNTRDLNINGSSKIKGSLYIPNGVDVGYGNKIITGGIHYMDDAKTFTMPNFSEPPDNLEDLNDPTVGQWPRQSYTIEQDGYYDSLSLVGNGSLTIDVGDDQRVLRIGTLNLSQGHINLIGNGKLFIFADQVFSVNGSSTLNSGGSSDNVHIFVSGTGTISLSGSTEIYGNIYAPDAKLSISGSARLTGNAIIGGTKVDLSGSTPFTGAMYAPNALVHLQGSSKINGALISKKLELNGSSQVNYKEVNCVIPGYLTGSGEPLPVPDVTLNQSVDITGHGPFNVTLYYTSDIEVENSVYKLYRKDGVDGNWQYIDTSTDATGAFSDTVSQYGSYTYKIVVANPEGAENESNEVSIDLTEYSLLYSFENGKIVFKWADMDADYYLLWLDGQVISNIETMMPINIQGDRKYLDREYTGLDSSLKDYVFYMLKQRIGNIDQSNDFLNLSQADSSHYLQMQGNNYIYKASVLEDKIYYVVVKGYKERSVGCWESNLMTATIDLRLPEYIDIATQASENSHGGYDVTIGYTPSDTLPEVSYKLYKKVAGGEWEEVIPSSQTGNSFTYTENSTEKIYYKVVAQNNVGHTFSAGDDESVYIDFRGAPVPSITADYNVGDRNLILNVDLHDTENITTKYKIYKDGILVFTQKNPSITEWADENVQLGHTYTYQVIAYNQFDKPTESNTEDVLVSAMDTPQITGVTIKVGEDGSKVLVITYTLDSNGIAENYELLVDGNSVKESTTGVVEFAPTTNVFQISIKPRDGEGHYGNESDRITIDLTKYQMDFDANRIDSNFAESEVYLSGEKVKYNINFNSTIDMEDVALQMDLNSGEYSNKVFYVPQEYKANGEAVYIRAGIDDTNVIYEEADGYGETGAGNDSKVLKVKYMLKDENNSDILFAYDDEGEIKRYVFIVELKIGIISDENGDRIPLKNTVKLSFNTQSPEGIVFPITIEKDIVVNVYSSIPELR
ncbi:hypothetical protein [Petroclostridium sp. X23]|uniref:DUF7305 domain-containing protein n=1 Tax=Petroclostridium sp. X23 TaxID=3045146 RepID=UPI0024AD07DB|nr:hypothetical protein [Petroclostridium sp. X23]WHH59656.1 hypothetical protein QKW49_02525 [Petroclostridium sp. X23]